MKWVSLRAFLAASVAAAPVSAQVPAGQLQPLPLTQLDERAFAADLDNRTFTLTFGQPVPLQDLLLLLVRGTSLSIVPDPGLAGTFIGELKGVTVRQALALILPPLGFDYSVDGSFIRVFPRAPGSRLFNLNYVAVQRSGSAMVGTPEATGSTVRVASTAGADVFADLEKAIKPVLSDRGSFSIDRKAGLLQVHDFPERLEAVGQYLDAMQERLHRQVQIDATIVEVELSDFNARSLDWSALARAGGAAETTPNARPLLSGLKVSDPQRFLTALSGQGSVSVLAQPRVLALNNEPAVVRGSTASRDGSEDVALGVTAQAADGVVVLSLSPIVSVSVTDPDRKDAPALRATREVDTVARVRDGETIVLAGFTREREIRSSAGLFGRSSVLKKRIELVILLTPRIVS